MTDYTGYVLGVYVLAGVVLGGLSWVWGRRLRRLQQRLQSAGKGLS